MNRCVSALVLTATLALGQTVKLARGSHRIELDLERYQSGAWRPIDPGLVLDQNDRVRFRFRSNFDGYLYVSNQGTSGDYTQLFPRQDTGDKNRVLSGREYLVPATADGSFKVTGPAGHDVVYWMVSPIELSSKDKPPPPALKPGEIPPNMTPRCDGAILRARGDCVDDTAGPRAVSGMQSRELLFIRQQNRAVVSSPAALKGPVIYEFHLAHR